MPRIRRFIEETYQSLLIWLFKIYLMLFLKLKAGVTVNGSHDWDPQIKDKGFWRELFLARNSLPIGEAYADGRLQVKAPVRMLYRALRARTSWFLLPYAARDVATTHYNLGQRLYEKMLGGSMAYTSGFGPDTLSLDIRQYLKDDYICRQLVAGGLKRGARVLDIGCGFGTFAWFAATHYGFDVAGISNSSGHIAYARERYANEPHLAFKEMDYRQAVAEFGAGSFDAVVSVEMYENISKNNYREFFEIHEALLKPGGIAVLQGITHVHGGTDPFIDKYIFPGGALATVKELENASSGTLVIRDDHEFGRYYYDTLVSWLSNFVAGWPELESEFGHLFDGHFFRIWVWYLCSCAAAFLAGDLQVHQFVFTRPNEHDGFKAFRLPQNLSFL